MRWKKVVKLAVTTTAIVMVVSQLVYTQYPFESQIQHQNTFYGFSLFLVFLLSLLSLKDKKSLWPLSLVLILLSVGATGYVAIFYHDLDLRAGLNTVPDLVVGAILVLVGFEATRRSFGYILPSLAIICILYTLFGHYLPQPFWHFPVTPSQAISRYSIGLTGIYGTVLYVSANYIFPFVIFGGLLMASGATDFFIELGKLAGRKLSGGPAMTAVISSALLGTATGTAAANVAITGSFTIPLMKKVGYRPTTAAAIEAAASTGGHIMPPVMTGAAFLMAAMVGISYVKVMAMAIIPAILYFLSVALFVQLNAMKLKIKIPYEQVDARVIRRGAPQFIIPVGVLLALLIAHYSPMYAAFWTIVSLVVVSLVRKDTRQSLGVWIDGLVNGAKQGAQIGVMSAIIGVIMASFTITGLGLKVPAMIEVWSGGYLLAALVMSALAAVILGCGMPTMAAYLLVILLVGPALVNRWGLPMSQAHFFVLFFASFSAITPPVAIASLVASKIAETDYMRTSFESVKAAVAAFLLPFMFLWAPVLLLQPATDSVILIVIKLLSAVLAIITIQAAICDYYLRDTTSIERTLITLSGLMFLAFVFLANYIIVVIAFILLAFITLQQLRHRKVLQNIAF